MEESEDNLSAEDLNNTKSPAVKSKPKKRSLVERELETSLTARVISPISADGCSTSRYGRARRLKNENSEPDKSVKTKSPKKEVSSKSTVQSPVYKMHASNSPIKLDSQKPEPFESQIENIYSENVALSRFGSAEKKISPSKRYPKVYIRKDLIQLKDKDKESEETVVLIKNMFSPVKSAQKSNRSSLERSMEKHGKRKLSSKETQSVVKTLDFDGKDNKKEDDKNKKDSGKIDLSKSEIFEIEAKSEYQVGDLAWARMGTYPFWPCIITREPGTELFVKTKLFGRTVRNIFNVTFFGDNGRRSWITDSMLRPFLGQLEFETTRAHFTPEAKKKDPKLYAAFFISERKMPQWLLSVEEAETLLREPKRLRIDILNSMLMKVWPEKVTPKSDKGKRVTRTDSDVSLSESLYDTLFSEDDTKGNDSDRKNKRKQSLDVSDVVTACLDNMAAKTGITKIQKQSHMDRWLLKAKTKTPEKSQLKSQAVEKPAKTSAKTSAKTNNPTPSTLQKPYRFRRSNNESQSSDSSILNDTEASTSSNYKPASVSNDNAIENSNDKLNNESNQTYVSDITNETNKSHTNLSDNDIFKSPLSETGKRISSESKNVLNKIKQSIDSDENMPSTSSVDISGLSTSFEISRVDAQSIDKEIVESDGNENLSGIVEEKVSDDIDKTRPVTSSPKNDVTDIEMSTENLNVVHEKKHDKSVKEITKGVEPKSSECSSKGSDGKDIDCIKNVTDDNDSDLNVEKMQGNKCTTTNIHKSKESEIEHKDGSSVFTNSDVKLDTNINNCNSVPEKVPQNFRKDKKIKTRQKSRDTVSCDINETKGSYCIEEKSNVCELNTPNTRSKKLRKSDVYIDVKLGKSTESVNNKINEKLASKTEDKSNVNECNELKQIIDSINHVKILNKSTTNIENDVHRTNREQKIEEKQDLLLDDKLQEISYEETVKKSKNNQVVNGNESLLISETKLKENDFASSLSESVPLSELKCIEQLSINNFPVKDKPKNDLKTEYNNPEFQKYLELKQDNVMDEHPELSQDEITSYLYKTWQYESRDIINNKLTGKDNKAPTKGTNYKALDKERGRIKLVRKKPNDLTQNKTILSPTNKSPVNGYHKEIKPIIISPKNKIIFLPKKTITESVKNNISYSDFKISSPIIAKLQTPGIENKVSISSVGDKTTKEVSITNTKNLTSELPSVTKVENGNLMLLNDKAQMTQNAKSNSNNIKTPEKENKLSSTENSTMPINSSNTDEKLITVSQSQKIPISENTLRTTIVDKNKNLSITEDKVNAPQNGLENIISTKPERNEPTTNNTADKSHTLRHDHNGHVVGPKVTTISASISNTKNKETSQNVNTFHMSLNNFNLSPITGNFEEKKPHISSTNKNTNFVDKETLSSEKYKLKETKVLSNGSLTKTEQRKLKISLTRTNTSDNNATKTKTASNTSRKTEKQDIDTQNNIILLNGNEIFDDVDDTINSNITNGGKLENHKNDVTCPVETLGEENKKSLFTSLHTNNKELNHVNEKLERNENSIIEKISVTNGSEFADSSTDYDKKCSTNGVENNKDSINSISSDKDNAVGSTAYENKKYSKITVENNHIQKDSVMSDKESTEYNNKYCKLGVVDNIEKDICSFKDKNKIVPSDSRNTESVIKVNSHSENLTLNTTSSPENEEEKITTVEKITSFKNEEKASDIQHGPTDIVNSSCISSKQDIENVKNNPNFQKYLELKQDSVIDENPELSHDEVVQYLYKTWLYEENNKCERKKTDEVDQTSLVKGAILSNGDKDRKRKKLSRKRPSDSIDTKKKQPTIINHFLKHNGFQEQFEKSLYAKTELQFMKYSPKTDFQQSNSPKSSKDTVSDYRNNEIDVKKTEEERNTSKSNDLSTFNESEDAKNQNFNESTDYEPEEYDDKKSVNEDITNDDGNFDSSSSSSTESESEMTISKRIQLIKRKRTQKENKKALMEPEFVRYLELKQDSVIDEHPELSHEEVIQYMYKTWLYEENNKSEKNITDEIDQTSLVKGASSIYADKGKKRKKLSRKRTSNASEAKSKPPTIINKFLMQNGYHEYHKKISDSNDHEVSSINTESRNRNVNKTETKVDNDDKSQNEEIANNDNLDNAASDSSESECEISLSERKQMWKEKRMQAEKKKALMDAEFVRYLELRQDYVMDEHPELTEEEITNYLYKTWLYEEKIKNDKKRDDDIDQTSLVKGVDLEPKKPKRKFKIVKEDSQESFKVSEVFDVEPKEKSKRSKARPYYNEEISDIEEELALFEIFRKKKPNKPNVEQQVNSSQPSQVVDLTHEEEIANIEDYVYDEMDMVEMYFEQLTTPKPNVFKGLVRERVCEICEKVSNLVKCKTCHGMFHADCVKNQHKTQTEEKTPSRGRKKKKKYQRRIKNSDETFVDDDHSDDKTQDGHSDPNLSIEAETEPIVADAEEFEAKASAKMREILGDLDNVPYDYESTTVAISWNTPGKCQIVDVKLEIKRPEEVIDTSNFKCKDCEKFETPKCFVCKSPVSPKQCVGYRQKCQVAHCHKYYHEECLAHWPQTQFNGGDVRNKSKEGFEAMSCPRHVCHTCVSDDPRGCKTRFSGDKLARCVRCPATYHTFTKCLPAGSQILTGSQIICPRHYEHRPGKVPCHVNTGWCFICALGGTLICCEYCPTSFHAECLNIDPPEGGYMCEDCETGRLPLYGEMVWVKLGHYRWWPGIILHPSQIPANIMAVKHSQGEFVVRFFGQYDHYWVNRGRVFPFQEGDTGKISSQKSKIDSAFTLAIEHASRACEILKNVIPDDEESQDIASSLLPPHYVKLKVNKPVGSLVNRRIDVEESSLTQCECDPTDLEPCGPYSQCLNRMLLTECGPTCRAGERCNNRAFEKRQYPKMAPYRTPHRGWGLRCLEDIKAGQFVIEYVGELLDEAEFQRRMRRKHEVRDENFYFLTLDKERMIDAGPKGNLARFMNHSCEPNCETQKWTVLGDVRVGLFAIDDIPANSELTFNYNLESAGIEKKQCMCGAKRCSGYIGAKPKQSDPQPKKNKIVKKIQKKIKKPESQQKRPRGRPCKPKELTDIEKDLLIIKNATNASDDLVKDTPEKEPTKNSVSEKDSTKNCSVTEKDVSKNCSVSSDSEYSERCSVDSKDGKAVKRKRSSQESLMLCLKRVKTGENEFRID